MIFGRMQAYDMMGKTQVFWSSKLKILPCVLPCGELRRISQLLEGVGLCRGGQEYGGGRGGRRHSRTASEANWLPALRAECCQ